jgi:hypothetical protein
MMRAKDLRDALQALGLSKIDGATLRMEMVSIQAWGPQFDGTLAVRRKLKDGSFEDWENRRQIPLGPCIVRNGYTDEGRRFVRRGEEGAAYDRWEHYIDSHESSAIYLPETATMHLDRCQIMSLFACARTCDVMRFQLWFDAGTSPNMIETFTHGDVLSVSCEHDRGRRMPGWEHTIETMTTRHNVARAGGARNVWPDVRRTMDAIHRACDYGKHPQGVAV